MANSAQGTLLQAEARSLSLLASTLLAQAAELSKLADRLDDPTPDDLRPQFAKVQSALSKTQEAAQKLRTPLYGTNTTDIGSFFSAIGSGVIDAQKQLDKASEQYIAQALQRSGQEGSVATAGAPPMATMFRIPRVTAELKCSLETDHERNINLVFYSDRSDVRELHQQTVQLEVVSVPAPPDYLNYLQASGKSEAADTASSDDDDEEDAGRSKSAGQPSRASAVHVFSVESPETPEAERTDQRVEGSTPPIPESASSAHSAWHSLLQSHLSDSADRQKTKVLIQELDKLSEGDRPSRVKRLLLPYFDRALVFGDGHNTRFILLAVQHRRPQLLLWQLVLRPASLKLLYFMPAGPKPLYDLRRIQRCLQSMGERIGQGTGQKDPPDNGPGSPGA
jgi:hypothetical protein